MTDTLTLPVSEVFGPTLQGEGPYAGRTVQFVRLGGCNLACSWCDTPYTWDASRYDLRTELPATDVNTVLGRLDHNLPVILSGGEPLIHQASPAFRDLLSGMVWDLGLEVHLETNGTIEPIPQVERLITHFAVSPKLAHAGPHKRSQNPTPWKGWHRVDSAVLKFVVRDAADVAEAIEAADHLRFDRSRVWVMPEGTTQTTLLYRWRAIATAAAQAGINATQRLHVLAWGDTKGT